MFFITLGQSWPTVGKASALGAESWGQGTVRADIFWGVLIVLHCASGAQLGLDIVVQIFGDSAD